MKYMFTLMLLIFFTFPCVANATNEMETQMKSALDTQIEQFQINKTMKEMNAVLDDNGVLPTIRFQDIVSSIFQGNLHIEFHTMFSSIIDVLIGELKNHVYVLFQILAVLILLSIAKHIKSNLISGQVVELASGIAMIVMGSMIFSSVFKTLQQMESTISKLIQLIQITFPILFSLLLSTGNLVQATLFRPATFFMLQVSIFLIQTVVIPWILAALLFSFVGRISTQVQMTKISGLLRSLCGWIIGFIFTLFVGIVSVQGVIGKTIDGSIAKSMKFAIGTFVPVVGKFLADSFEMVAGCAVILKQSLGVALLLGISSICLIPLLQLFIMFIVYKIAAVVSEPMADERFVNLLDDTAILMLYAFASFAVVILLFYFLVTSVTLASQIGMMAK